MVFIFRFSRAFTTARSRGRLPRNVLWGSGGQWRFGGVCSAPAHHWLREVVVKLASTL